MDATDSPGDGAQTAAGGPNPPVAGTLAAAEAPDDDGEHQDPDHTQPPTGADPVE